MSCYRANNIQYGYPQQSSDQDYYQSRPTAGNGENLVWPEGIPSVSPVDSPYGEVPASNANNGESEFLCSQLGKTVRAECVVNNSVVERIGVLSEVGDNYIVLDSPDNGSRVLCNLDSLQFITVPNTNYGLGNCRG